MRDMVPHKPKRMTSTVSGTAILLRQYFFTLRLLEALARSGYVNPVTATSTDEKVRRLVRRLEIPAKDVPVILGMLRQILWKLQEPKP